MTDSVLLDIADNADLIFDLSGSASSVIDPETGDPIVSSTSIVIRATIKGKTNPPREALAVQPTNRPAQWVVGKCVSPAIMPPEIAMDATCLCKVDHPNGSKIVGTLYLYPKVPSGALTNLKLTDIAGQKIQGWFDSKSKLE